MHRRRWDRFFASSASGTSGNTGAVASRFLCALDDGTSLVGGIDTGRVLVDIDDSIIEVHGHGKQGSGYGYSGVRELNALITTVTTETAAPVIIGQRLRRGACGSARGAARMVADALATVDRLRSQVGGAGGARAPKVLVRGDSAFYGHPAIGAAIRAGADVSVTVRLTATVERAIASIGDDESAWTPIEYTDAVYDEGTDTWISRAEVAEIPCHGVRLLEENPPEPRAAGGAESPTGDQSKDHGQGTLFEAWRFHAFSRHHRPRRPRYRRRPQNPPSARRHRTAARGSEELRPRAPHIGPVHRERRLARLRGDGLQSHPRRRYPHRRSEAHEGDDRHPPPHHCLGPRTRRLLGETVDAAPPAELAAGNSVAQPVRQHLRSHTADPRPTPATPARPRRESLSGTTRHERSAAQPCPHTGPCHPTNSQRSGQRRGASVSTVLALGV
ncbi:putative transposase [Rhodococcus opacus B4]|uniref:Putative transposase n=1 Tax=Rhodococcus opacus (strain B4) TaxID=632772 RepID=C1B4Y3_RHOOB|nr:putative transposase [Rhodococcus opacus B4]